MIIVIISTIINKIKYKLNKINSKYLYWNEDDLKMETWEEYKKRVEFFWATKQLKDILTKQYKKEYGDLN